MFWASYGFGHAKSSSLLTEVNAPSWFDSMGMTLMEPMSEACVNINNFKWLKGVS